MRACREGLGFIRDDPRRVALVLANPLSEEVKPALVLDGEMMELEAIKLDGSPGATAARTRPWRVDRLRAERCSRERMM